MRNTYLRRIPAIDKDGNAAFHEDVMVETAPHRAQSAESLGLSAKEQARMKRAIVAREGNGG